MCEERRREKTVDYAQVPIQVAKRSFLLRDTTAHDMYVKNVILALDGVDCACLVVGMLDEEFMSSVLHEKLNLMAASSV